MLIKSYLSTKRLVVHVYIPKTRLASHSCIFYFLNTPSQMSGSCRFCATVLLAVLLVAHLTSAEETPSCADNPDLPGCSRTLLVQVFDARTLSVGYIPKRPARNKGRTVELCIKKQTRVPKEKCESHPNCVWLDYPAGDCWKICDPECDDDE